ncbi:hypothetical protein IAQ61_005573 [Plenodomus lingam]|uniref:uncharacterized protein n=1 Tax=Leptosphaeria maculans TaxID=5022 RepID=UPI00332E0DC3|nr:hypothetical protein IAQ61_005573 [Plenodomus lingam]
MFGKSIGAVQVLVFGVMSKLAGVCRLFPPRLVLSSAGTGKASYLDETNVGGLLAEALTADVKAVLADQTSRVGADAAESTMLATFS